MPSKKFSLMTFENCKFPFFHLIVQENLTYTISSLLYALESLLKLTTIKCFSGYLKVLVSIFEYRVEYTEKKKVKMREGKRSLPFVTLNYT